MASTLAIRFTLNFRYDFLKKILNYHLVKKEKTRIFYLLDLNVVFKQSSPS